MKTNIKYSIAILIIVGSIILPTYLLSQENQKILLNDRAIEVIRKKEGVYFYTYPETIEPIDPLKDYIKKYRIHKEEIIIKIQKLITENREYKPQFKARCLPVWDYGLEFRSSKESHIFLFSFRCRTIKYVNENIFKDFTPQSLEFYKIFKYEIDDKSAYLVDQKND
ncbi:MAG: hypothetical protein KatS3mg129_1256 [Leptospiraceae bacterium]|nr:MAG: hypothetical protein KatS3mg129_1256 [Leptospiraceae bacterium]